MISMRRNRPRAQVALKKANHEFKAVLSRWETAYNKENFYQEYGSFWSFSATVHQSCDSPAPYFKCLLTALVI
jgi:hypothetical protein